jgi:Na+-driven multidrug efflux pump
MAAIGALAIISPSTWTGLFTSDANIQAAAASYLLVVAFAYPFVGAYSLNWAFQSTRQPRWPLAATAAQLLVVVVGCWISIHIVHAGLVGLAAVTALGLVALGGFLAGSFRLFAHSSDQRQRRTDQV